LPLIYFILTTSDIAVKIKKPVLKVTRKELYRVIMPKILHFKNVLIFFMSIVFLVASGCKGLQKPGEFVESLRNPTSFPEIFLPEIKNIDEIVNEKALAEDENIMIIPIGKDKSSSIYLFQIRENAEMDAHYHKSHDVIMYIKKGSGILELDGSRYSVKEGMMVVIPRLSVHKFTNTGEETNIVASIFSPPFDGNDIKELRESAGIKKKKKTIYDKAMKKSRKEMKKEDEGDKKWLGLWGKDEEKVEPGKEEEGQSGDMIEEEQKILVLTEEGEQKIREARKKVKKEEKVVIDRIVLDEKLKVLQKLKDEGLISQEEFEAKRTEVISESGLKN
jgi:quercetin dioxygenase-like cupin family protein